MVSAQILLEGGCPNGNSPPTKNIKSDSGTPLVFKRVCSYFYYNLLTRQFARPVMRPLKKCSVTCPKKLFCIVLGTCKVILLTFIKVTSKSLEMTCQKFYDPHGHFHLVIC